MPVAAATSNVFTFSNGSVAASGEGTGYEIKGSDLKITDSGTYTIKGSSTGGTVTVGKSRDGVTLILDGIKLSNSKTSPITIDKSSGVTIQVIGANEITDNENIKEEKENGDFEGAGIKVKGDGSLKLTGSGTLTIKGNCKNGIKGASKAAVIIDGPKLNITAANDALSCDGTVTVQKGTLNLNSAGDGIKASPDTDDKASAGTVTINGGKIKIDAKKDGIQGEGGVTVNSGTFDISTGGGYKAALAENASAKGIKSAAEINLSGGTYTIDSADDAIHGKGNVTVDAGTYTISTGDDALHSEYVLNVGVKDGSGPHITIKKCSEGFEGAIVNLYSGSGNITASDDGINAANSDLKNSYAFAINSYGGNWGLNAGGDAVDSNKDFNMYGGTIEAFGASQGGDSALDYNGSATYKGGTLLAVGRSGMAQGFSNGTFVAFGSIMRGRDNPQKTNGNAPQAPPDGNKGRKNQASEGGQSMPPDKNNMPEKPAASGNTSQGQGGTNGQGGTSVFTIPAGSTIAIKGSKGNVLYKLTAPKKANSVVFADDDVVSGQAYTLYIDGKKAATSTATGTSNGNQSGTPAGNPGGTHAGNGWPFLDVVDSSWYYSAVNNVYQKKIMKGVSANEFNPDGSMTRAMLAQILYNIEDKSETTTDAGFSDIKSGAWYESAVNWAAKAGVVNGYDSDKFGPADAVTREQMATLMYRYAAHKGYDTSKTTNLSNYGDYEEISEYAKHAMAWANATGLITGTDKQTLLPLGYLTRAQAATIFTRFSREF